ncbi:MAG: N-acetylmuramoyl-L-alanine amidase [Oscillospiraceae bacterium]
MSNSALVSYTRISPNSSNPRNKPITKITPHHMAGNLTLQQFGNIVAQSSRQMSANYAIDSAGGVGLFCDEKNRSWCSSSPANDNMAITIEVANDGGAPDWHVSDAAIAALVNLCVDICQRNGIAALNFTGNASGNLTQHNYFASTACPGPYLKSKFPYIAAEVNKRLSGATDPAEPQKEGVEKVNIFKITATGKKNVQGFGTPNVDDVVKNNLPDGTYLVYKTQTLTNNDGGNTGITGAQIRLADGSKIWAAALDGGYTAITQVDVADAESLLGWYAAGAGADTAELEKQLAAANSAADAARKNAEQAQAAQQTAEELAGAAAAAIAKIKEVASKWNK